MSSSAAGQRNQHESIAVLRRRAVVINGLLYTPLVPGFPRSWQDLCTLDTIRESPYTEAAGAPRQSDIRTDRSSSLSARIPVKVTNVSIGHVKYAPAPAKRRTRLAPIKVAQRGSRAITAAEAPLNTPAITMGPPSSIPMLRSKKLPSTRRQSQQQGLRLQWERSKNRLRNLFD